MTKVVKAHNHTAKYYLSICLLAFSPSSFAGKMDAVKVSPSGRFVATGNQDGIQIKDVKINVTTNKYGHPLGFTTPVYWISDSALIVNTSCCEAGWWFITYWPSGNTIYLKPKNGASSAFDRTARTYMTPQRIDSLLSYLKSNATELEFDSDSLMIGVTGKKDEPVSRTNN